MNKLFKAALPLAFTMQSLAVPSLHAAVVATDEDRLNLECLQEAYPDFILGIEHGTDGFLYLNTTKVRVLYNDGKSRTGAQLMDDADVEDSMREPYPLEPCRPTPGPEDDPGRVRSYALLRALYGSTEQEALRGSTGVMLAGTRLTAARRASKPLAAINTVVTSLLERRPGLRPLFRDVDCMCWRTIAGTKRLSPHSWGTAVDITPDLGPYWQWSKKMPHPLQKTYVPEVVRAFEDNGFIWGGKWRHYDLMHFEYRPELIIKARKLSAGRLEGRKHAGAGRIAKNATDGTAILPSKGS